MPGVVGVPVIWPPALIVRPAGKLLAVNVYGAVPLTAVSVVAVYATFAVPFGRLEVVIASPGVMVIDKFAVLLRCVGFDESVTVKVICVVPAVVGAPEIWPAALIVKPAGRAFEVKV